MRFSASVSVILSASCWIRRFEICGTRLETDSEFRLPIAVLMSYTTRHTCWILMNFSQSTVVLCCEVLWLCLVCALCPVPTHGDLTNRSPGFSLSCHLSQSQSVFSQLSSTKRLKVFFFPFFTFWLCQPVITTAKRRLSHCSREKFCLLSSSFVLLRLQIETLISSLTIQHIMILMFRAKPACRRHSLC